MDSKIWHVNVSYAEVNVEKYWVENVQDKLTLNKKLRERGIWQRQREWERQQRFIGKDKERMWSWKTKCKWEYVYEREREKAKKKK